MRNSRAGYIIVLLTLMNVCPADGQVRVPAPEASVRFEAADIHHSLHPTELHMYSGFYRNGRYQIRNATLVDLVENVYSVDADKVLGGPNWLDSDRFDVTAKAPANSTPEALKGMLRALLADRFQLVAHTEKKELPTYALTARNKLLLRKADGSGDTGCRFTKDPGVSVRPILRYECHNMTMAALAEAMHTMTGAADSVGANPLLDQTGLQGAWDFNLKYGGPAVAGDRAITLFDAVDKQLGLRLEPRTAPVMIVAIDSVNRKPVDNLPGVTKSLPAVPTEFEVADVRPTDPNPPEVGKGTGLQSYGRVDLRDYTLQTLIAIAWDVALDEIVGAPKFLYTDRFTIVARAPAAATSVSPASNSGPSIDNEAIRQMLRTLLVERFKLATHHELRPLSVYTLTVVKPQLRTANPSNRTGCHEGPGADGKDPRITNPALSRLVTCQNMTMTQFVEHLADIAPRVIPISASAIVDATGIDGAFDFTLSFSPDGRPAGSSTGQAQGAGVPEALDPGAMTLFDAIEKQMGLRLSRQKRPTSVLVIDHVEQKPTDN